MMRCRAWHANGIRNFLTNHHKAYAAGADQNKINNACSPVGILLLYS